MDGKELAIYKDSVIQQWNVYGLDNVGKLVGNKKYYYMKDHLGSIRAILNEEGEVVSGQDFDMWGYLLDNRTYESNESKYKFTSKERDKETSYDYSYARNYNSRVGIFNSSEPIPSSSFGWSSYIYCADNPLRIIDPMGEEWYYIYDEPGKGSWQFYEDEEKKYIWSGQYDVKGNRQMEWKEGYKELLFFEGSELQWLMESGERMRWEAVSGILNKVGETQPQNQYIPVEGPIPEGWWGVDPQNAYSQEENSESIYDMLSWYFQKGGRGMEFINIFPTANNPTPRREGFSIHGGNEPGSIGCIDLTSSMKGFYYSFKAHNKSMLLNVKY